MLFLLSYEGTGRHNGRCHDRDHQKKRREDIVEDNARDRQLHAPLACSPRQKLQQRQDFRIIRGKMCRTDKNRRENHCQHQGNDPELRKKSPVRCHIPHILFDDRFFCTFHHNPSLPNAVSAK